MDYRRVGGILLFIGAVQFVIGMHLAEFFYSGYSVSENYISDLGATCRTTCIIYQPSAFIFNTSVIIFGIFVVVSSYFIWREFHVYLVPILFVLSGIGAIGVGLFPETAGIVHQIVSFITFFFGGLSVTFAYKLVKTPFTFFSVMGIMSLIAIVFFISGVFLGIGIGGMERMIVYPLLLWIIGFGGYLMSP